MDANNVNLTRKDLADGFVRSFKDALNIIERRKTGEKRDPKAPTMEDKLAEWEALAKEIADSGE
jgi:hypothetical protein